MKRLVSLFAAVVLVLALSAQSFAAVSKVTVSPQPLHVGDYFTISWPLSAPWRSYEAFWSCGGGTFIVDPLPVANLEGPIPAGSTSCSVSVYTVNNAGALKLVGSTTFAVN